MFSSPIPQTVRAAQKGPDARRSPPAHARRTCCTLSVRPAGSNEADGPFSAACLGLGEGDEERAKLHGLEAGGDLAVLPCPPDPGEMEAGLVAEAATQLGLAENTAVIGVAVHGLVVRDGSARAELV